MNARRKHSGHGGKYVRLEAWVMKTSAWKSLRPVDVSLYIQLKYRFNGTNNGQIGFGAREAGEALNVSKDTANRSFKN